MGIKPIICIHWDVGTKERICADKINELIRVTDGLFAGLEDVAEKMKDNFVVGCDVKVLNELVNGKPKDKPERYV